MQRNALLLLALSCLVALAGCAGMLSGGGGADGPTLEDVTYPDGVSGNGTNVSALADAHTAALDGRNFTLELDTTRNSSMGNRSLHATAVVGADRDEVRANVSGGDERTSVYLTEDKRYTRTATGGNVAYRVSGRAPEAAKLVGSSYSGATYLGRFAGEVGANFTPAGVREVDGTTLIVLRADGSNVSARGINVTRYNATMLVDEQGVVRRFEVTVRGERDGMPVRVSLSMRISDVDETTVEEPGWLDEARNRTTG